MNIPSSIPKQLANGCSSTSSMYYRTWTLSQSVIPPWPHLLIRATHKAAILQRSAAALIATLCVAGACTMLGMRQKLWDLSKWIAYGNKIQKRPTCWSVDIQLLTHPHLLTRLWGEWIYWHGDIHHPNLIGQHIFAKLDGFDSTLCQVHHRYACVAVIAAVGHKAIAAVMQLAGGQTALLRPAKHWIHSSTGCQCWFYHQT